VSFRENRLIEESRESFLWYETDTDPGSSGSPVFDDQWTLVGWSSTGDRTNRRTRRRTMTSPPWPGLVLRPGSTGATVVGVRGHVLGRGRSCPELAALDLLRRPTGVPAEDGPRPARINTIDARNVAGTLQVSSWGRLGCM